MGNSSETRARMTRGRESKGKSQEILRSLSTPPPSSPSPEPPTDAYSTSDLGALWMPPDQIAWLGELLGRDAESKIAPLRRDVRCLGTLLGQVVKEQCGDALFNKVESLRALLIRHREAGG